ncbi:VCBS repeat-containing protein [Trichlorobacter ammonificans]|uniref:VCBS repeat-containing protein n=1 Tax=Trichlorobacter ammonificans TaxID=2916410 RepID=UPI002737E0FE|nr:VCBS repeat-containing protein [Trichlorobacter ammonificans]
MQALLASRIGGPRILAVASAAEAEVTVNGTYLVIGKNYSLDAVAKGTDGQTISRTFVQGEGGQEVLFGAAGALAEKLSADLVKQADAGRIPRVSRGAGAVQPPVAAKAVVPSDIVRADAAPVQRMPQADIIRSEEFRRGTPNAGEIRRLDGVFNLMTPGGAGADGKRLLFLATSRTVQLHREGETHAIAGFTVGVAQKIIGLDYVDGDGNGTPELYVTVMNQGEVASQVWELKNNKLVKVAEDIPYFFRAIALAGGPFKLYAQEQGRGRDQFYGDVFEVTRKGKKIIRKARVPMPRYGNIFSFNQFRANGELLTVVYHEENYLIVYDKTQKELWRSNDRFGGSELYYQVEDLDNARISGDKYRWFFLNQRMQVTTKNELLVGKNEGFFVIGNARMYKKGAVYSLYWNGAALEEAWRTKDTQNYMPDFYFDESRNELLLLQLNQREDVLLRTKGASSLQIKKVE